MVAAEVVAITIITIIIMAVAVITTEEATMEEATATEVVMVAAMGVEATEVAMEADIHEQLEIKDLRSSVANLLAHGPYFSRWSLK